MRVKLFWKYNPLGPRGWFSFTGGHAQALEDEINTWLRNQPGIKVVEIKQSASDSSSGQGLWLISVCYEEGGASSSE
jgi:hypothetical protein